MGRNWSGAVVGGIPLEALGGRGSIPPWGRWSVAGRPRARAVESRVSWLAVVLAVVLAEVGGALRLAPDARRRSLRAPV